MTVKGKTVAYLYDEELGNYSYGGGNPMRPHRVRLTHSLVENYGLGSRMIQHRPTWQTQDDISQFHADGETCSPLWGYPHPSECLILCAYRGASLRVNAASRQPVQQVQHELHV
jgi:hypothetical protein